MIPTNCDVHADLYVVHTTLELTYLSSCHDVSMLVALAEVGSSFADVLCLVPIGSLDEEGPKG